jgi:hypothetical protein
MLAPSVAGIAETSLRSTSTMLIDIDKGRQITRIPFKKGFDAMRKGLTSQEFDHAVLRINELIDAAGSEMGAALLRRREPVRGRSLDPSQSRLSWRKRVRALAVRVA